MMDAARDPSHNYRSNASFDYHQLNILPVSCNDKHCVTHINTCMCVRVCVYVCVYVYACMCACISACVCVCSIDRASRFAIETSEEYGTKFRLDHKNISPIKNSH